MGPCWRRPRPIEIGTNANTGVIQYTEEEKKSNSYTARYIYNFIYYLM